MPWKPWDEMSTTEQRLYVLVQEQAHLWEVLSPGGASKIEGPNTEGLLDEDQSRDILLDWLGQGLVGLYRDAADSTVDLPQDEAERAFRTLDSWKPGHGSPLLWSSSAIDA
jgi:hypothetical protein